MMRLSATRRALLVGVAFGAVLGTGAFAADKPTMGVVVKIGGIPWFNAMETGIKEVGARDGVDAIMIGPTSADPALQVRAIEDSGAQIRLLQRVVTMCIKEYYR